MIDCSPSFWGGVCIGFALGYLVRIIVAILALRYSRPKGAKAMDE